MVPGINVCALLSDIEMKEFVKSSRRLKGVLKYIVITDGHETDE
jgi:hypothetical protein